MHKTRSQIAAMVVLLLMNFISRAAELRTTIQLINPTTIGLNWNSETNGQYLVQYCSSLTSNSWSNLFDVIRATGPDSSFSEPLLKYVYARFYRVKKLPPFFPGISVLRPIELNGHDLLADSFDSGTNTASTAGQYDATKAGDHCDVAAPLGMTNTFTNGIVSVYGRLFAFEDRYAALRPTDSIGDKAWHTAGNFGIEPGFLVKEFSPYLPQVTVPFANGEYFTAPSLTNAHINGMNYYQVFNGGNYKIAPWNLTGASK